MRRSSLSPRYQISIRSILLRQDSHDNENRLSTLQEMDSCFDYYCKLSSKPKEIITNVNTSIHLLNQQPQQIYYNKRTFQFQELHPIVLTFTDYMINTLFQALIANSVKNTFKIDKTATLTNILVSFGIQANHLKELSEPQRRNYIIEKFNETTSNLLQKWKKKVKKHYRDENIRQENKDLFDWLKLDTKYDALKQKLKQILYQKLQEYENQVGIIEEKGKIYFKNIKKINTSDILVRMDPFVGHLLSELKVVNSFDLTKLLQYKESKQRLKDIIRKQSFFGHFEWNEDLELNFLKHRQQAKLQYASKIQSSNFNNLGFLSFTRAISRQEQQQKQFLTAQEYNFINQASQLLVNSIDKVQYQKRINRIDQDQLQILETNLAEQIIERHEYSIKIVNQARIAYLQKKCWQFKKQASQKKQQSAKVKQLLEKHKQHRIYKKRFERVLNSVCKVQNYFVFIFFKEVMRRIRIIRERKKYAYLKRENKFFVPIQIRSRNRSPEDSVRDHSGGPTLRINRFTNLKAIIKIQSLIRMFIYKRRYQKIIQQNINNLISNVRFRRQIMKKVTIRISDN